MEFSILSVLIGIGIAVYIYNDSKKLMSKDAQKEVSRMSLIAIEGELERMQARWEEYGVLTEKEKALMDALQFRRSELKRNN